MSCSTKKVTDHVLLISSLHCITIYDPLKERESFTFSQCVFGPSLKIILLFYYFITVLGAWPFFFIATTNTFIAIMKNVHKFIVLFMVIIMTVNGHSSIDSSSSSSPSPAVSSNDSSTSDASSTPDKSLSFSVFSLGRIKEFFGTKPSLDLARTFSSLKGALSSPMTALMYAGSLAVGAIVMLAFYESPISPLPVPSLPDPPVGRFPPEHPVWPPPVHSRGPQGLVGNGHDMSAASEIRPVMVPHPNMKLNPIHRRAGVDQGRPLMPTYVRQVNPGRPKVYMPNKATKLVENPVNWFQYQPKFDVNHHNNNNCNGTLCNQNANVTTSISSSPSSKDKTQKAFDLLMPRTSSSSKQTLDEDTRSV
ncbi:uncharacterized protein LOC141857990 [Brevipalpus obovatus]|uniref:uncharacterized protein LOC141857990 n=1 Tax=Brevipalpus obovatus TaxID=246614 RepID=UPI003D9ED8AB